MVYQQKSHNTVTLNYYSPVNLDEQIILVLLPTCLPEFYAITQTRPTINSSLYALFSLVATAWCLLMQTPILLNLHTHPCKQEQKHTSQPQPRQYNILYTLIHHNEHSVRKPAPNTQHKGQLIKTPTHTSQSHPK